MSNELIRPIDEDTTKAIQEAAKLGISLVTLTEKAGSYASGVLGQLPHNLVGLFADYITHTRIRRAAELFANTKRILDERSVKGPYEEVSPSIALPLLEAAVDETRDGLKQLWEKLLASAMDPERKHLVRKDVIAALKEFEPIDALILDIVYLREFNNSTNPRQAFSNKLGVSEDDVLASFYNLEKLKAVALSNAQTPTVSPGMAPLGNLLMKAIR